MTTPSPAALALLFATSPLAAESHPPEVAEYIAQREICEHFREEPWPEGSSVEDKERREFIAARYKRYCTGSDQTARELKGKYKNNRTVMDRLEKYEADIEGTR